MKKYLPFTPFLISLFFTHPVLTQCPISLEAGPDIYACMPPSPATIQLHAELADATSFEWLPPVPAGSSKLLHPTLTLTAPVSTFVIKAAAEGKGPNLIFNGDFEQGNVGFTSAATYTPGTLGVWPTYDILPNASVDNIDYAACPDHTTQSGNMMAVQPPLSEGFTVWCQTVNVDPNTNYDLSFWVIRLYIYGGPFNNNTYKLFMNGKPVTSATPPGAICKWSEIKAKWNSGSATSVEMCIEIVPTFPNVAHKALQGFGLDDISMRGPCFAYDSTKVFIKPLAIAAPAHLIVPCSGSPITINATNGTTLGDFISYEWTLDGGNIVSGDNTLTPVIDEEGIYSLNLKFDSPTHTCELKTQYIADLAPPLITYIVPSVPLSCLVPQVALKSVVNFPKDVTYTWTAENGGHIVSGETESTAIIDHAGKYYLLVTNTKTGCTATTEYEVPPPQPPPIANATATPITCTQLQAVLSGEGSSTALSTTYKWTTLNGAITSDPQKITTTASTPGTYILEVMSSNGCKTYDTVVVISNLTKPILSLATPETLDCKIDTINLFATFSPASTLLAWTASNGGNIVSGANTAALKVNASGTYTLTATHPGNGCTTSASVAVLHPVNLLAVSSPPALLTCAQPALALNATGSSSGPGIAYIWTTTGGHIQSGANTLSPIVTAPGTYRLLVSDTMSGCSKSLEVNVSENKGAPKLQADIPIGLNCKTLTNTLAVFRLDSLSNVAYHWSTVNGNILTGDSTLYPIIDRDGAYTLIATNSDNGCTSLVTVLVTADVNPPTIQAGPAATLTCAAKTFTLNGSASSTSDELAYEWSGPGITSGETTLSPEVDKPGTYTLLVTDLDNGCTAASSVTIGLDQTPPLADAGPAAELTCTSVTLLLQGSATSASNQLQYQWTASPGGHIIGSANIASPAVDQAGIYTLLVTDLANGCTATNTVSISEDKTLPTVNAGADHTLICGKFTATLEGSGSANGGFTSLWETADGNFAAGQNTLTPVVDAPGTYTLIITSTQNGCTATDQALVQKDVNVPIAIAQAPAVLNCLTSSIQLDASGTSQGTNFTYKWTTTDGNIAANSDSLTPTVDAPGTYTLSVFNSVSQCTATTSVTVQENLQMPAVVLQVPPLLTCKTLALTIDGSNAAQGSNYTYKWATSSGGNITSGATGLTPTVNKPGTYTVTVTDTQNGCTTIETVTVLKNTTLPIADAGPTGKITCTESMITLNGTGSSTGGNFTHQWSTQDGNFAAGENTLAPVVDAAGTYLLMVTDTQNGCTATDQVVVEKEANVPIVVTQAPGVLDCKTSYLQLSAAGTQQGPDINYLWATTNGKIVSGANTLSPTVNAPGVYTLQVSNATNHCTSVATLTVLENKLLPIAQATAPQAITCKNLSVELDGAGSDAGNDVTYLWTTANGHILSGENTLAPTVNQAGLYTLLITNSLNGCTNTAAATVLLDQATPFAQISPAKQLSCTVVNIQLDGLGSSNAPGLLYLWSASAGGNILSGGNSLTPLVNAPGQYGLLITDPANGCTAQASVVVSRDVQQPIASVAQPAVLTCAVTTLSLDGTGSSTGPDFTYLWKTSNGSILSGSNTLTPTIEKPGVYNLLITNTSNGCTRTLTTTVVQDIATPQVDAGASQTLICKSPFLTLAATATGMGSSFEFLWSTPDGQILSGANSLSPTVGKAGTYVLLVKNLQNGCSQSDEVVVLKDQNAPVSAAGVNSELSCKTNQLSLDGTGSSIGVQYTYSWSTASGKIVSGGNTLSPVVSKPGIYTLTVTDVANTCTTTATVTVLENKTPPPVDATATATLTCQLGQTTLQGNSTAAVAYTWSGPGLVSGGNTATPIVQTAGTYALLVTDLQNGCTNTATVQVFENKIPPTIAIAPPGQLNCLILSTPLDGTGGSTGSDFSPLWTGPGVVSGGTSFKPIVNQPGVYTLSVLNQANGCTATATATVGQDVQPPTAQAGGGFELNCTVESGSLTATGSSSGVHYTYLWTGAGIVSGASTGAPKVSEAGLYTLTVRNTLNGCSATASVSVTENQNQLTGLKSSFMPPDCKGRPGQIRFEEVLGGTPPYAYSIDNGATFGPVKQFEKLAPGTYALLVQDANGCEYAKSLTLPAPVLPKVSIQPEVELVFGQKETLTAVLNIPLSEVDTVIWSPMEGLTRTAEPNVVIAQPLRFTKYEVRVVNKQGCEDRALLTVRVDKPQIWAPNVFSPKRQNGRNDWFLIFAGENTVRSIRTFQIFDRWGTMVFRNDDLLPNIEKMGWDGRFRGAFVQPAVFVWYAEVVLSNGEEIVMKGDVTIVD